MLELKCSDMGFECGVVMVGKSMDELEVVIETHAIEVHGLEEDDFTPELNREIKAHVRRT